MKLVIDLSDQYKDIKKQLMGDEDITLEMQSNPWFAILQGDQYGWNLKLILDSSDSFDRGAEFSWPREVTSNIVNAMRKMWDSDYL